MSFQGLSPIFMESVSAVTGTPSIDVGVTRTVNGEDYIYVYNAGNSQINPGYGAVCSAVSGYSVTVSSTTGQLAIGFCKHATITTGAYGYLLTKGFVTGLVNAMASTALAAGAAFQMQADGKICTGETGPYVGAVQVATGSAGVAAGFVRCFGG